MIYPHCCISCSYFKRLTRKDPRIAGRQWIMPVILATLEAEIRRIKVQSQPQANSLQDPILKKHHKKKGWLKV
jgi:hypothetical protein